MNWRGQELDTIGDLMRGMESCETPEEAQEFMRGRPRHPLLTCKGGSR